ncbi:MAG: hypothetical protein M1828_004062 [Chrysothrix sp. TS-e1954]|nr:MAG: hypothetical protein M1828_004062 [Chrysothrix sp. TS-e1954]
MTRHDRRQGCVAYDASVDTGPYDYKPNEVAGIIFSVIFVISTLAHSFQYMYTRKWFYVVFSLAATGEAIGWIARTYSHWCPYNSTAYSAQISSLILAPCFFSAGLYYALNQLIKLWGRESSPLPPIWYLIIFMGADTTSIVIQAIGGAIASDAADSTPQKSTTTGTNIMIGGIIFQLVSMSLFAGLWVWVNIRARKAPSWYNMRILIFSISITTVYILVRNLYRAIELSQGWNGFLISHEVYFDVLDGALMSATAITLNLIHPAFHIPKDPANAGFRRKISDPADRNWSPPMQKV